MSLKVLFNFFLIITQVSCTNVINIPKSYGYLTLIETGVDLAIKTLTFWYLIHQMYHFHRYEFNRMFRPLFLYYLIDMMSFTMTITVFTLERLAVTNNNFMLVLYLLNIP
jgi:hypothetical protein